MFKQAFTALIGILICNGSQANPTQADLDKLLTTTNLSIETADSLDHGRMSVYQGGYISPPMAVGILKVPLCSAEFKNEDKSFPLVIRCPDLAPTVFAANFVQLSFNSPTYVAEYEHSYGTQKVPRNLYVVLYKDLNDAAFAWYNFNSTNRHELYKSNDPSVNLLALLDQVIECHNDSHGIFSAACKKLKKGIGDGVRQIDLSPSIQ